MVKWFGLGIAALVVVEPRYVVEAVSYVRVLRTQGLFSDHQCTFVERFGLSVAALGVVEVPQVVGVGGEARMIWPKRFFVDQEDAALAASCWPTVSSSCRQPAAASTVISFLLPTRIQRGPASSAHSR